MKKLMKEYTQVLDHLAKGNFDIMKLPEDMLLPYLKENGYNAVYDKITKKNVQNIDMIDHWQLTELQNNWIEFKKHVESEVAEIVQTHHYEDMEVTEDEKKLLYQFKIGLISQEEFEKAMDQERQKITQKYN